VLTAVSKIPGLDYINANYIEVSTTIALQIQGFAVFLQHCLRPQSSVTSLYGRFRAPYLPYKEVTEL